MKEAEVFDALLDAYQHFRHRREDPGLTGLPIDVVLTPEAAAILAVGAVAFGALAKLADKDGDGS